MMKKLLAVVMILVLLVGVFSACSNKSNNSEPKEVLKVDELPEFPSGVLDTLKQDDMYITRATQTAIDDYNAYIETLLSNGFFTYSKNQIDDNSFTTLVNDATRVTLSYFPKEFTTTIIAEPKGDLFKCKQDNKYKSKNIQSTFTGMKGETVVAQEGMGFIIRLDDGSFIIIDGGMGDPDSIDSTKLYNILKEQSPEGTKKPRIAAWIFTHCHGDHIGVFNTFSIDYHNKVDIEAFYYNFQTEASMKVKDDFMLDNSIYRYTQFKKAMKEYYPNVPKVRIHTGDKVYIRNAVIDVLFSYEYLFPNRLNEEKHPSSNAASLIFKINIAGQSIMITGDIEEYGMNFAYNYYDSYLKSDILQMAHHGMNHSVDFYSAVDPTYVILPLSHPWYEVLNKGEGNIWLRDSKNVRQIIEFGSQSVSIPLPYNPLDSEIEKIPNASTKYKNYQY